MRSFLPVLLYQQAGKSNGNISLPLGSSWSGQTCGACGLSKLTLCVDHIGAVLAMWWRVFISTLFLSLLSLCHPSCGTREVDTPSAPLWSYLCFPLVGGSGRLCQYRVLLVCLSAPPAPSIPPACFKAPLSRRAFEGREWREEGLPGDTIIA